MLSVSHSQYHAGESEFGESENMFPMPSQGKTPPGTAPTVTSMSSINNTVATPANYHTKNDPRGLNVFKQEKQKVCHRELTDLAKLM
jgi:hypothetical protein